MHSLATLLHRIVAGLGLDDSSLQRERDAERIVERAASQLRQHTQVMNGAVLVLLEDLDLLLERKLRERPTRSNAYARC